MNNKIKRVKKIIKLLVLVLVNMLNLLALPVIAQTKPALPADRPNIVFILMDNLGYGEVGCYGGGITRGAPTPRIDKLATEGTRLLNFNVEAQCTPSRSALLTGRFSIRSGTHSVPIGGGLEGMTQWEITIAEKLSAAGYATAALGKWHLGSENGRLPNDQGFDEWYGIPRTTDEAFWPSSPMAKAEGIPFEHIMEGRKGEKSRELAIYDLDQRRLIDAEISRRSIDFMKRSVASGKSFYLYIPFTLVHFPTLPNPKYAGKTGYGDFPDALAEMDAHVGEILDAIDDLKIRDNTIVIFTSDNGPEATWPWQGSSGPWRGYYFTHMEGSLRTPFIIRWPGKIPAGRASKIINKLNNDHADVLHGYYVQAGYFFHEIFDWWPKPLEFAMRNAGHTPNNEADSTKKRETSAAFNRFFNGHANKLTLETSYFNYDKTGGIPAKQWRFRLQWDISL